MNVSIRCYIFDLKLRLPEIDLLDDKDTDSLKCAIKTIAANRLAHIDALDLDLYKVQPMISVLGSTETLDAAVADLFPNDQPSETELEKLVDLYEISELFPGLPPRNKLHIVVRLNSPEGNSSQQKQLRTIDDARLIIKRWRSKRIKSELPAIAELSRLLDLPLSNDEKIPISVNRIHGLVSSSIETRDICTSDDVGLLFRAGHGDTPLDKFFFTVAEAPPIDGTEASFHHFWDKNVRDVLEFIIPQGKSMRNSSQHTATRSLRPDYAFLLRKLCPFRGEERAPESPYDPKAELAHKFAWVYAPAPYVLGYYATGPDLTLVAISPPLPGRSRPVVRDIAYANLRLRRDRIRNICRLINLAGLVQSLADVVRPADVEFEPLERDNGTVEIAGHNIIKVYKVNKFRRVTHIRNVYHLLQTKQVPHVDSLVTCFDTTIILSPRGIFEPPGTENELLDALICVLEALEVLHQAPPLFHRDIRWPNVMRRLDDPHAWFLIDWEDAAAPPTTAQPHFDRRTHSPHIFIDGHSTEVDMWGVGELIVRSGVVGISSELQGVGKWMQCPEAPSAREALYKVKAYRSSHP